MEAVAPEVTFSSAPQIRLLSRSDCQQAIELAANRQRYPARVQSGLPGYRSGNIVCLERDEHSEWLYRRIEELGFAYARQSGFVLDGIEEQLQIVEYSPGTFFNWHVDVGNGESVRRKVTVLVQLSRSTDYDGGDLEFVGELPWIWRRAQGNAVAFPALLGHRVSAITRGERRVLVGWLHGPPFR